MKSKRLAALLLVLCILMSLAGCGSASETAAETSTEEDSLEDTAISLLTSGGHSDTAGKEETVYVVADAAGTPKKIIVENWLKNPDGSDKLTDRTELTDVENTKGDEDYTENADGTITWNANGSDIYYQGKTDKDLPVDVSICYTLDGKEVSADELAGASGHLIITFQYTNNTGRETAVDGKKCTIYQPYVMVSGLLLDNDKASNVTVTNGKTVNDGDRTVAVGMAVPGLNESLGLTELADGKVELPEEVTVEADVTDFSLLTTLTIATDDALGQLGLDDIVDLDDMEEKIGELTDGATKLVDGTKEFSDYMGQLNDASGTLSTGAADVDTYMNALSDGLTKLQSAVTDLPDGTARLLAGTEALSGALKSGYSGSDASQYGVYEALEAIAAGADSVSSATDSMMSGASAISDAAQQIAAGAVSGDTADAANYGIYEAAGAVKAGLAAAEQQLSGLSEAAAALGEANTYSGQAAGLLSSVLENGSNLTEDQQTAISGALTAIGAGEQYVSAVQGKLNAAADFSSAYAALDKIQAGAQSIQTAAGQIAAGAKSGDTSSAETYGLYEAAAAVKAGAGNLSAAARQLMGAVDTMTNDENLGAIIDGLEELNYQSGTLIDAVGTLQSGASSLSEGTGTLSEGMNAADSAVKQLYESSLELKDGMAKLDSDGIAQIAELVQGNLESVFHRLQAVQDYASERESFSGAPDGVESSVKFIWKTDSVEK